MKTTRDTEAARAFAYAARNPRHLVLIERESSEGRYVWHLRADGSRCCEGDCLPSKPTRSQIRRLVAGCRPKTEWTHVVLVNDRRRIKL